MTPPALRVAAVKPDQPQAGSTPHAEISRWLENARTHPPARLVHGSPEIPHSAQTSTASRRKCRGRESHGKSHPHWHPANPGEPPSPSTQSDPRPEAHPSSPVPPAQDRM